MKRILTLVTVVTLLLSGCGMAATQENTQAPATTTAPSAISPTAVPATVTPRPTALPSPTAAPLPTATLLPPPDDQSTWTTYHDPDYGFSFRYPAERWTPVFPADDDHLLSLAYHEMGIALRIKVARADEGVDMQLYGGAAGDFVPQGTVMFLGEEVGRSALVYEDITRRVYYNETNPIQRGDLLFSFALVSNRDYSQGAVVPEDVQAEADQILETFALD